MVLPPTPYSHSVLFNYRHTVLFIRGRAAPSWLHQRDFADPLPPSALPAAPYMPPPAALKIKHRQQLFRRFIMNKSLIAILIIAAFAVSEARIVSSGVQRINGAKQVLLAHFLLRFVRACVCRLTLHAALRVLFLLYLQQLHQPGHQPAPQRHSARWSPRRLRRPLLQGIPRPLQEDPRWHLQLALRRRRRVCLPHFHSIDHAPVLICIKVLLHPPRPEVQPGPRQHLLLRGACPFFPP